MKNFLSMLFLVIVSIISSNLMACGCEQMVPSVDDTNSHEQLLISLCNAAREGRADDVRWMLESSEHDLLSIVFPEGCTIGNRTLIHVAVEAEQLLVVLIIVLELLASEQINSLRLALIIDNACAQKTAWHWQKLRSSLREVASYGRQEIEPVLLEILEGFKNWHYARRGFETLQQAKRLGSSVLSWLPVSECCGH